MNMNWIVGWKGHFIVESLISSYPSHILSFVYRCLPRYRSCCHRHQFDCVLYTAYKQFFGRGNMARIRDYLIYKMYVNLVVSTSEFNIICRRHGVNVFFVIQTTHRTHTYQTGDIFTAFASFYWKCRVPGYLIECTEYQQVAGELFHINNKIFFFVKWANHGAALADDTRMDRSAISCRVSLSKISAK